ncbi:MAG: glycosyltransferase family 39 protein [Anaerolineales bacterium]
MLNDQTLGSARDRPSLLPLVLLTTVALAVRLIGLGRQSLWFDESVSVFVARLGWREGTEFLLADGVHPPLYYAVQKVSLLLGSSEWAARLPAAVFGALTVALLYRWSARWVGPASAALAATLLALSPLHVWYSREARMYSLLVVLALAAMWLYTRMLREPPSPASGAAFVAVHALAYLTHYFAALLFLIQLAHLALHLRRHARELRRWAAFQALAFLPLAAWAAWVAQRNGGYFGIGWIPVPTWQDPWLTLINFTVGYTPPLHVGHVVTAVGILGLALRGLFSRWPDPSLRTLFALWALFPVAFGLVVSLSRPLYVDRFFLASLPPLLVLAAVGWARLPGWTRPASTIFAVLLTGWGLYRMDFASGQQKEQWREAGLTLAAATSEEIVIPRVLQIVVPLSIYYHGDAPVRALEVNREVGSLEDLTLGSNGVWLVFWNAAADAHTVAPRVPWDPSAEHNPEVIAWLGGTVRPVMAQVDLVGVTIVHFGPHLNP